MPGVFEIRVQGNEIFYADAKGDFLIQGALIDTKQKRNLTEERTEKLSAVPFDSLPLKFAITQVRGNGKRKLVVFSDPNCGYCKRFERDLQKIDNVTLYHLMYPVLGEDSRLKSRNIACAKDRAKTWNDWMLQGITPPTVSCDNHNIDAIVEFGRKNRINGTPTMFVADGTRVPGAIDAAQIEALLNAVKP
jgi:thiol:disulfide interchange protein DsbC